MVWLKAFVDRWMERRTGREHARTNIQRAARDVVGPTGNMYSNGWEALNVSGKAYMESFDRRIPHSEFISDREKRRAYRPIPTAERCLEDHGRQAAPQPAQPRRALRKPSGI